MVSSEDRDEDRVRNEAVRTVITGEPFKRYIQELSINIFI